MPQISKVRIVNFNYNDGKRLIADELYDFSAIEQDNALNVLINLANGTRRQVLHIIEVDPSNPDVSIVPGYYQIDKDLENEANWSHKELTEMAK
ncbi:MAG: hypothetical protein II233_02455, partial [Clostridia bacterium]|nr:hypothetical protein [Clostridia bacterium]